jgi:hypothetical protein
MPLTPLSDYNMYTPRIGTILWIMDQNNTILMHRIKHLSIHQLDFIPDGFHNSIATLLKHMAAIETYFCMYTIEHRNFREEELAFWHGALPGQMLLGITKNAPLEDYAGLLSETRQNSKKALLEKKDEWLAETCLADQQDLRKPQKTNGYYWVHILHDQNAHYGQIIQVLNALPRN